MPFRILLFHKATLVALILLSPQVSFAQELHAPYLSASPHSNAQLIRSAFSARNISKRPVSAGQDSSSVDVNTAYASPVNLDSVAAAHISGEQNKLLNYLKDLGMSEQKHRSGKKFYYHMANVFARLKLYPLAMKCFFKAAGAAESGTARANAPERKTIDPAGVPPGQLKYAALEISSRDDAAVETTAELLKSKAGNRRKQRIIKSRRTSFPQILSNFNDGKTAVAYALLFHVKQPAPGKRRIFVGINTGHTFITLIKYNTDASYASASFGFYPDKDQLLSATPLAPTTSATFKDDTGHLWDEVLGKFISRRNFENILELTQKFEGMTYNLNRQNCTDFGLQAASLVGIHISDTFGKWPGGRGNNPAVTGQSILAGKISQIRNGSSDQDSNEESAREEELFMDQTVTAAPF